MNNFSFWINERMVEPLIEKAKRGKRTLGGGKTLEQADFHMMKEISVAV